MQTFMELCQRRQSCRDFADKPVEHEKLVRCIEAARLSPSGCNAQPWSFVVVENPAIVPEVAKTTQQLGFNDYIAGAKAFIIVLEEHAVLMPKLRVIMDSQIFAKSDIGMAVYSICLQAEDDSLGTCILGMYDRGRLCELLDIPKDKQIRAVIAVGYPANDTIRNKVRKPIEDIVRYV